MKKLNKLLSLIMTGIIILSCFPINIAANENTKDIDGVLNIVNDIDTKDIDIDTNVTKSIHNKSAQLTSFDVDSITIDGVKRPFTEENGVKTIHLGKVYNNKGKNDIKVNYNYTGNAEYI